MVGYLPPATSSTLNKQDIISSTDLGTDLGTVTFTPTTLLKFALRNLCSLGLYLVDPSLEGRRVVQLDSGEAFKLKLANVRAEGTGGASSDGARW